MSVLRNGEGHNMKRVSILVFLMVSLVELDLERYRIYLFLSITAFAVLVRNLIVSRRKAQNARRPEAFETSNRDSERLAAEQDGAAYTTGPIPPDDRSESVEPAQSCLREEALVHDNSK
jgi:hypothetical protein